VAFCADGSVVVCVDKMVRVLTMIDPPQHLLIHHMPRDVHDIELTHHELHQVYDMILTICESTNQQRTNEMRYFIGIGRVMKMSLLGEITID
jgi:hypothetical protein